MNQLQANKVKAYKLTQQRVRLFTPEIDPNSWYIGATVYPHDKPAYSYKETVEVYEGREYTRHMVAAQNMSMLQIRRQEKMHGLTLSAQTEEA